MNLLEVEGLRIDVNGSEGPVPVVQDLCMTISQGEAVGLVGESGAGKTLTALALVRLLPPSARVGAGRILWRGEDVLSMEAPALRDVRGGEIGMVFQEPGAALHPQRTVASQIEEAIGLHRGGSRSDRANSAQALLRRVGLAGEHIRRSPFPHQWSGGMQQRAMIAMAIANGPKLLVADEPTTALDVTVQADILDLLGDVRAEEGLGILLISHDLAVVGRVADRVLVMRDGRIVEEGPMARVYHAPRSDYTRDLVRASRVQKDGVALDAGPGRSGAIDSPPGRRRGEPPIVSTQDRRGRAQSEPNRGLGVAVRGLVVEYRTRGNRPLRAVDGVDLRVLPGRVVGLVGESGSGKSSLARGMVGLAPVVAGSVDIAGATALGAGQAPARALRRRLQLVFQDPLAALNPRRTIGDSVAEPLRIHRLTPRRDVPSRVRQLLVSVGLDPTRADRLPAQLSGGERQRACIARALAADPDALILDEPLTAVDGPRRLRLLALIDGLRRNGLACLLIAHDLELVRSIADSVAVMYFGRVVELGPTEAVFGGPEHPYTRALLSASPPPPGEPPRERIRLAGRPPDMAHAPTGCRFRTRCWNAEERCAREDPKLLPQGADRACACFYPLSMPVTGSI